MSQAAPDPFIDEVRWLKHEASAQNGHDLNRLLEDLRRIQSDNAHRLVRREGESDQRADRIT